MCILENARRVYKFTLGNRSICKTGGTIKPMEQETKVKDAHQQNFQLEQMRKSFLALTSENTILKENIASLEKAKYEMMIRVKELTDAPCCGAGKRAKVKERMIGTHEIPDLL